MPEKLMLLDGMSLAHRAFYALPPLTTSDGRHVNAVLGFLNMFLKFYEEEAPDYVAVAFDLPAPTFRHKLFSDYKGTRDAMPMELRPQIPLLKEMLGAMGVAVVEKEGFEADDLLGTFSRQGEAAGLTVTVVTGDRDLLQTATGMVCIKIPKTRAGKTETESYFAADVLERMGVTPVQFIDVKALWGDASDNIPGVPGIGEKTATKIIQAFGSVENAINHAGDVTPKKASENLITYKEQALLSKTMAAIVTDVDITLAPVDRLKPRVFGAEAYEFIKKLEFRSLYGKFAAANPVKTSATEPTAAVITLDTDGDVSRFVSQAAQAVEAYYIILYNKNVFEGVSIAIKGGPAAMIPAAFADLDEERILRLCAPFFQGQVKKNGWDLKHDMHRLASYGITLDNPGFDAMLASHLLGRPGENFTAARTLETACAGLRDALTADGMEALYEDIESPLMPVLYAMETAGVKVDRDELVRYGGLLGKRIDGLTLDIYNLAQEEFNINSTKQLGYILFEKLGLPEGKSTKTGYSTAADVLERLADYHPIVGKLLEYRQLTKLKSTYADGLLAAMDKTDGRIHSTFTQAATSTGRLSSAEPNLQNIPIRTELGRELRKAFIPENKDYVFVDADYSQIELRVLAHMSGDETFIDAFNNNLDIHSITAAEVFGGTPETVTAEQRSAAKAVNFGIIYGQSAFSFANDQRIPVKEAERYITGYFNRYPRVKDFMDETVKNAKKNGYTTTIMGRRRRIPELSSPNHNTRSFGERAAMNMPIQGSAADIIKIAMLRVGKRLNSEGLRSRLILQVHDELLIEAHVTEVEAVRSILFQEMEQAVSMKVPLRIDVKTGRNWFEAK